MPIRLHDSLTRSPKDLVPTHPDGVYRFYNCGPTVYAPAHIGNFRTFVVNDVLRRLLDLEFPGKVKHVRNLTDVDDKTIKRARDEGRPLAEVTKQWTDKFHADCDALNCLRPHVEPTATGHIKEQVDMIDVLMKKGNAYRAADGSVYFKVASFDGYGRLSRVKERELQVGSALAGKSQAVDADEKEDATDFALWKAHKAEDGSNSWDSPWGAGRPGWHIECSAMSKKHLGDTIDLHTGGVDLLFPHHENEIAQSECCNGTQFSRHWYHSEHLLVDGKKMSKSLGNLYTLDDLKAKGVSPMALRYALLAGHPRKQLNFTLESLHAAESALHTLRAYRASLPAATTGVHDAFGHVITALHDDLNTPAAFGALFTVVNRKGGEADLASFDRAMFALGLDLKAADLPKAEVPAEITAIAEERWAAKKAKDFGKADAIRKRLIVAGWNMQDSKDDYKLEAITNSSRPAGSPQISNAVPLVPSSQNTFQIRLSDVPEALKDEVNSVTGDYTVPIIINDELVGSGTLVKIRGRYGVLTAEHVINHPTKPHLRLETTSAHGPKLLLPPANFPGGIPVDSAALQIISTKRTTDELGPDLALVVLPPCPLLDSLKARKSFYPLEDSPKRDIDNAISEAGFASFCGFPSEHKKTRTPSLGYKNVVETRGYAFLTGIDRYDKSGGWDYFELGVSRDELGDFLESFGGVSGGGLWRFQINRSANAKEGSETLGLLTLAGVAFYEEEDSKNQKFFIRAHGAESIYTTFLKQIRSTLGAETGSI